MGLHFSILLKPVDPLERERIEFLAVSDHARYRAARTFMKTGKNEGEIENPFSSRPFSSRLLEGLKLKGVESKAFRHIPLSILQLYDPGLYLRIHSFDSLSFEEKNSTIEDYQDAVKFFAESAVKRVRQITFLRKHLGEFSFVDPEDLEENDSRTLLQLVQQHVKTSGRGDLRFVEAIEINRKPFQLLRSKIKAIEEGKRGVLFVDLDETLINIRGRALAVLKDFDDRNKTSFFKDLVIEDFPSSDHLAFARKILATRAASYGEFQNWNERLQEFYTSEITRLERYETDTIFTDMKKRLSEWSKMGLEIVFITQRSTLTEEVTRNLLEKAKISYDDLLLADDEGPSERKRAKKVVRIESYLKSHSHLRFVGFFENRRDEVKAVAEAFPIGVSLEVVSRWNSKKKNFETVFISDSLDLFNVLGTQGCATRIRKLHTFKR
jgi:hypothetical protein